MKPSATIYQSWVPQGFLIPILMVAMFPHLMLLFLFSMNSSFTASFLDAEPDDIQFIFSIAYATLVGGWFIYIRFCQAFNVRSYLLLMTLLNIGLLGLMTLTSNAQLIMILRFVQGPISLFEGCILLPLLMAQFKSKHAKFIGYSVLYLVIMTCDKFATTVVSFAIEHYDHNMILYTIIMLHIVALLVYLLVFRHGRVFPKKPLYQLQISSVLWFVASLIAGAYFFVYGKRYLWLESYKIVGALLLSVVCMCLFIWQLKTSKRPLFHLNIFRSERIKIGMFLFFCFYLIRGSMGNIYQVMGQVWKWPWENILATQYVNVLGTLLGVGIAILLVFFKLKYKYIYASGFALLGCSMYVFSQLFYYDTNIHYLHTALFIQGLGQGLVFAPLVFYMFGAVEADLVSNVAVLGTSTRFWSTTIGFSIIQNSVWYLTNKYQTILQKNYDLTSPVYQEEWDKLYDAASEHLLYNEAMQTSMINIKAHLQQEALLISNMEIFQCLAVLAFVVFVGILVYKPIRQYIQRIILKRPTITTLE